MFTTLLEVRKEYDEVSSCLVRRDYRYNEYTDTYYAPKGDDEGRLLCKKYKVLSRMLDAWNNLEELYAASN